MQRWTEEELRAAVEVSDSFTEVLLRSGLRAAGGNFRQLKRWLEHWDISTEHFTHAPARPCGRAARRPLEELLVERSSASRRSLKARLFAEGLKARVCELCGQGEEWRGARMALILDHVNGVHDDNRLENLRVVCPNCNATLPTHCGGNHPRARPLRPCACCERPFRPDKAAQRFCSRQCFQRSLVGPRPAARKVERPPYEQLLEEIATSSWSAVGRKYGVSCNAVRKWVRSEQRLRADAEALEATDEQHTEQRRGAA